MSDKILCMNKMTQRPILSTNLDSETFRSYYYLKEELVGFCRDNGMPTSGGKIELTDRIAYFLDTGKVKKVTKTKKITVGIVFKLLIYFCFPFFLFFQNQMVRFNCITISLTSICF